jgi:hypothetical protein
MDQNQGDVQGDSLFNTDLDFEWMNLQGDMNWDGDLR